MTIAWHAECQRPDALGVETDFGGPIPLFRSKTLFSCVYYCEYRPREDGTRRAVSFYFIGSIDQRLIVFGFTGPTFRSNTFVCSKLLQKGKSRRRPFGWQL